MSVLVPEKYFDLICSRATTAIAIVGMTKNVGKTVTLNYLIRHCAQAGRVTGLVSAGYDGERFDRLTLKDKPRIYAPAGSFVATAKACLDAAGAVMEPLYRSRISTPLGEVWIAVVKEAGLVELAGPGSVSGLKILIEWMSAQGAHPVLIDGAINRQASASPLVAGEVILASGAAVAATLDDVIRKTLYRCILLETPALEDKRMERKAREAICSAGAAVLHPSGSDWKVELLSAPIPLMTGAGLKVRCEQEMSAVVLGGALVDKLLIDLLALPSPPLLVLRDATRFFVSAELFYRYLNSGGVIRVLDPIKLCAVTLNPTDPLGKGYPPQEFLKLVGEALAPRPVFDLILKNKFS
ncbi:MAG: hypothetical protein KGZ32_04775 [Dethiobacter sp.]|jgi:hypothetical protein|nr:hypothetical protein [Dethiobacter sp.]